MSDAADTSAHTSTDTTFAAAEPRLHWAKGEMAAWADEEAPPSDGADDGLLHPLAMAALIVLPPLLGALLGVVAALLLLPVLQ